MKTIITYLTRVLCTAMALTALAEVGGCSDDKSPFEGTWASVQGTSRRQCPSAGTDLTTTLKAGSLVVPMTESDGTLDVTIGLDSYTCEFAATVGGDGNAAFTGGQTCLVGDGSITLTDGAMTFVGSSLQMNWSITAAVSTNSCTTTVDVVATKKN